MAKKTYQMEKEKNSKKLNSKSVFTLLLRNKFTVVYLQFGVGKCVKTPLQLSCSVCIN